MDKGNTRRKKIKPDPENCASQRIPENSEKKHENFFQIWTLETKMEISKINFENNRILAYPGYAIFTTLP